MTNRISVPLPGLPDPVRTYLTARASGDVDRALSVFSPAAEVADDGRTYQGTAAIRTFLTTAGAEFDYTTTFLSAEQLDDGVWVAHHRIEGDFPGGVALLAFRFELSNGLIARLHIAA
jgi:hypothetical protein